MDSLYFAALGAVLVHHYFGVYLAHQKHDIRLEEVLIIEERCYRWNIRKNRCFIQAKTSANRTAVYDLTQGLQVTYDPITVLPSIELRMGKAFPGLTVRKMTDLAEKSIQRNAKTAQNQLFEEMTGTYIVAARDKAMEGVIKSLPVRVKQQVTGREQIYQQLADLLLDAFLKVSYKSTGFAVLETVRNIFPEETYEEMIESALDADPECRKNSFFRVKTTLKSAFGQEMIPFLAAVDKLSSLFSWEDSRDIQELLKKPETDLKKMIETSPSYL